MQPSRYFKSRVHKAQIVDASTSPLLFSHDIDMTAIPRSSNLLSRLWERYLFALKEHPIRTKMITSGSLYVVGDNIAQFGIEGRTLVSNEEGRERYDVGHCA
jgi:protein Mpv17